MIEAGLDHGDADYVLRNGKITEAETEGDGRRYRVEEITRDGVPAAFIVAFSVEEKWIEIITAFRLREQEVVQTGVPDRSDANENVWEVRRGRTHAAHSTLSSKKSTDGRYAC